MMIIALGIGALCLWAGYKWGFGNGQTQLERSIVRHVIDSPEYGNQIVDAIKKSLTRIKK